jgi:nicotinamide-nucleotide amidase
LKGQVSERRLTLLAEEIFSLLKSSGRTIVLAESCTAGLVSAVLARVPGVSAFHCGSAVVYQVETKARWLGVSKALLKNPGPVSVEVVTQMALGALKTTPHADVAAAVTGHLGPGAPDGQDGLVYLGFVARGAARKRPQVAVKKLQLDTQPGDQIKDPQQRRLRRQRSATAHLLSWIIRGLRREGNH